MKRAVDGCRREDVEHLLAVGLAAARLDDVAEHHLLAGVVQARVEREAAALPRAVDRPAGERARHLGDVLLRVAAVDAERVQLHQLAAVVLVEALGRVLALRPLPRRRDDAAAEPTAGRHADGGVVSACGPFGSALIQLSR